MAFYHETDVPYYKLFEYLQRLEARGDEVVSIVARVDDQDLLGLADILGPGRYYRLQIKCPYSFLDWSD